ncbi:MAG TPA: hypothetical protein VEJ41_05045 [Candidatus Acidoferrales bacterium]|nr:hypothetical protein [Candidatus Acidoferrales bacterium]
MSEKRLPDVEVNPVGFTPRYAWEDPAQSDREGHGKGTGLSAWVVVAIAIVSLAVVVTLVVGMMHH